MERHLEAFQGHDCALAPQTAGPVRHLIHKPGRHHIVVGGGVQPGRQAHQPQVARPLPGVDGIQQGEAAETNGGHEAADHLLGAANVDESHNVGIGGQVADLVNKEDTLAADKPGQGLGGGVVLDGEVIDVLGVA